MICKTWKDGLAVVVAGGQSLSYRQLSFLERGMNVIVVNNAWELLPEAPILYASDFNWWHVYQPSFAGWKLCSDKRISLSYPEIDYLPAKRLSGLSFNPNYVHDGRNSGYEALNLAVLLGATRILLLGFDMRGSHWHAPHPGPKLKNPSGGNFALWRQSFAKAAVDLRRANIEVINCSPDSALDCFPKMTVKEALNGTV